MVGKCAVPDIDKISLNKKKRKSMKKYFSLVLAILILQIGISQIDHKRDQEEFLESIQAFMEANELGLEMVETMNNGEVPNTHKLVKKITQGISISEKVSHSYLHSKDPKLLELYYDFVNSFKQILQVYDEIRDPAEITKIQIDVEIKQSNFMNFLKANEELFSDDFQFVNESEIGVKDFVWFIAKVFLVLFPFLLLLYIFSIIFNIIALVINRFGKDIVIIYFLITSAVYLILYGFLGAYYRDLYEYYSMGFRKNWLVYIICLLGISFIYRNIRAEVLLTRQKLNQKKLLDMGNVSKFSIDDLSILGTMNCFQGSWFIMVSFLVFTIFPDWVAIAYGELPHYAATLFN